ncbi:hypothetical protein RDWZM_003178 [Blomia tropicalis]|uniref:methylenetetrahydrofolate reductase (NADPH) n=1 Tax=Blomia tropicalis TaxID=40697 RepID=A0A9Q0RQL6_BLOTA|nr:hypothetical protein RDWZM_003178 [Blomia tropicalis]
MLNVCKRTIPNGSIKGKEESNESSIVVTKNRQISTYQPLSEKIARYQNDIPFFSIEFFPPRSDKGATDLVRMLDHFRDGEPFFCDITWHTAGNPGSDKPTSSITFAGVALNYCCLDTMLHIICLGLTKTDLRQHLERAKFLGIKNILALRGDKNDDSKIYDFEYAADLVRFIRQEYGDYFTIVVAGYPIPHPESKSKEHDLECLKRKVDAGADAIITQLFFEVDDYVNFVQNCRQIGINVPIIPGICSINNYGSILKFASLSSVPIPDRMMKALEPIKTNTEAVKNYGIHFLTDMCRQLIKHNLSPGLHFYTLNQKTIIPVLKAIGLWKHEPIRLLPWRPATNHRRTNESTRSVFWINRPKSYINRTFEWKRYPNIWNTAFSNQIADLSESYYPFLETSTTTKKEIDQFWTDVDKPSVRDVFRMFYSYYSNINYGNESNDNGNPLITILPWIQERTNIHFMEAAFTHYGRYIKNGLLITNYLPGFGAINQADDRYGWGEPNGVVYQKEYLEFFFDSSHLDRLKGKLERAQSVSYCITNRNRTIWLSNWPQHNPITISWGLFPSYQLIPAYVADPISFNIWRTETFDLFTTWHNLYRSQSCDGNCHDESMFEPYRNVIKHIRDDFLLVSLIDNQSANSSPTFTNIFDEIFSNED